MKLLNVFLKLFAAIILLLVIVVIALQQLIDPNDYKPQISQAVKKHTGMHLSIDGDLSLSFFPWIGVHVEQIRLSQPENILQSMPIAGDFARIQSVEVRVKVKPLLQRKVEVDTIHLKQPYIEIITDAKGNTSLDGLSVGSHGQTHNIRDKNTGNNRVMALAALSIAGVNISDGQMIIDDHQTNIHYKVEAINMTSGNVLGGEEAPLTFSATINSFHLPPIRIQLDTQLRLHPEQRALTISDFTIDAQQANNTLNTMIERIRLDGDNVSAIINHIHLTASVDNTPFTLSIPDMILDINQATMTIPRFNAESIGVDIRGNTTINNLNTTPVASGHIRTNALNATTLLEKLAIDYRPSHVNALSNVSFAAAFRGTPLDLSLQHIKLALGKTTITGDVSLFNFYQPKYRFNLSLDDINIDDFLPTTNAGTGTKTEIQPPLSPTEKLAAPLLLLKDSDAIGTLRAKKITANNMVIENNVLTVVSNEERVVIKPRLDLYQGKMHGTITLHKVKKPYVSVITDLQKVNLESLLSAAEITNKVSGIGNISTHLTLSDKNGTISREGSITLSAHNGAIKGIDIKQILDGAQMTIDRFRGKQVTHAKTSTNEPTRFAEMHATLWLNNRHIRNSDLSIKAPAFRVSGNGAINLATQTVDYLTLIHIVNTNAGQGGKDLGNLKGITLPVRFSGSLAAPAYKIDTKALLKASTSNAVNIKKSELKDMLLKKLGTNKIDTNHVPTEEDIKALLEEELSKELLDKLF